MLVESCVYKIHVYLCYLHSSYRNYRVTTKDFYIYFFCTKEHISNISCSHRSFCQCKYWLMIDWFFITCIDWLLWFINTLIDWLVNTSVDWLIDWLIDWLNDWSIHWFINKMIDWLIDWLIVRSINWTIDRSIDWFYPWIPPYHKEQSTWFVNKLSFTRYPRNRLEGWCGSN